MKMHETFYIFMVLFGRGKRGELYNNMTFGT